MDAKEAEFLAKLLETYKIECDEHLKSLINNLLALEANPIEEKRKTIIETIYREAHSLKGASRAVNFSNVERLCQKMENILSALKKGLLTPTAEMFDSFYAAIDWLEKFVKQATPNETLPDPEAFNRLLAQFDVIENPTLSSSCPDPSSFSPTQTQQHPPLPPPQDPSPSPVSESKQAHKTPSQTPPKKDASLTDNSDRTIRVSSTKLNRLLQQVEEMLIVKLTAAQRLHDFKSLATLTNQWDKEWSEIQMTLRMIDLSKSPLSSDSRGSSFRRMQDFLNWQQHFFKIYKETLQEYTKTAAQDYRTLSILVDTLLDDTKNVLMQPFSSLLEAFPRMVRDISHTLEKEIHFQTGGGDTEIDRRILEELKDPLMHLIRNSIDHGIENTEQRLKLNKPTYGLITVAATQVSGSSVEIIISDDGRGINPEKVKESALKQGIITPREATEMNRDQLIHLIFHSGISTSPLITELSGRGLGMGIVAEKVEKLGGQLFVETEENVGTTFRILLPLTLATFRGIHVKAGNQDFIIPTQSVKRVIRLNSKEEIKTLESKETILHEGKTLSYVTLTNLLALSTPDSHSTRVVLILKTGETTIAVGVDQVLNEQEFLIKSLGKQLVRVKNFAAATVLESGKVIPILDPFDLVKTAITGTNSVSITASPQPISTSSRQRKKILIAEDSVTARILLQNILETAGYDIKLAEDGAEAFTFLKTEKVDLLLSDVEMPRMTGFELTAKVRQTEGIKNLPIILCTSRGSKEDREHGIEVGANAYIDKNHFVHSNLLDIIQKLL